MINQKKEEIKYSINFYQQLLKYLEKENLYYKIVVSIKISSIKWGITHNRITWFYRISEQLDFYFTF